MFKQASKQASYTLNKIKTRFTNLHARTALELQLVPSIIENITPYLSPPPPPPPPPRQKSLWIRPWCISFPFAQNILINVFYVLVPGQCIYVNPEVVDIHVFLAPNG